MERVILQTEIPGRKLYARGKVRDSWLVTSWPRDDSDDLLLMITTDRSSAFDVVMSRGVPELGKIRNQISLFWFNQTKRICPNHIFFDDQTLCVGLVDERCRETNDLLGRCVLVHLLEVFGVECVVRGFISGSGWKSYQETGMVCGIKLPPGLKESEELPGPIFTPTTKARTGHDEPLTFDHLVVMVGGEVAETLRDKSLQLYKYAVEIARSRGIIIADTKFEFGAPKGKKEVTLVDELLTPDSSRFWDLATFKPGGPQPSFDKQPLRDWLETTDWNKKPPPPPLPDKVVEGMRERYVQAYQRLTGQTWSPEF